MSTCALRTLDDMKAHTVSSSLKAAGTVAPPLFVVRVPRHAAQLTSTSPITIAQEYSRLAEAQMCPQRDPNQTISCNRA
jgi:hypothetical protein